MKFHTLFLTIFTTPVYSGENIQLLHDNQDWVQQFRSEVSGNHWEALKKTVSETKIDSSDGNSWDTFGYKVSISGNRALVGAQNVDVNGNGAGAAYIFEYDGINWVETQKLLASDGAAGDSFGEVLDIEGNWAFISSRFDDDTAEDSGSVYIFMYDGTQWIETQKLVASDASFTDLFGNSISISGSLVLVGASSNTTSNGINSGSVYIFQFDGQSWVEIQNLIASDGFISDNFGSSVSLSGTNVLIGSKGDDVNGINAGSAYMFTFDGNSWLETQKFLSNDSGDYHNFGDSVSLSEAFAIVGSPGDDTNGSNSGSAYIYKFDGINWNFTQKLIASEASVNDLFGQSVSLSESRAIIGASYSSNNKSQSGSAYVFEYTGSSWVEAHKLFASDYTHGDRFGESVSLSGDSAFVGAFYDDDNGVNSGSAYIYIHYLLFHMI